MADNGQNDPVIRYGGKLLVGFQDVKVLIFEMWGDFLHFRIKPTESPV